MSNQENIRNTSSQSSRTANKLPPPLSSSSFRFDAPTFTPKKASEVFFSSSSELTEADMMNGKEPRSPFYPMEAAPFIPPDTPALQEHSFSSQQGSFHQTSATSAIGNIGTSQSETAPQWLPAAEGRDSDRTYLNAVQGGQTPPNRSLLSSRVDNTQHVSNSENVSSSTQSHDSKASSSRTSPSPKAIMSPSPRRRYSMQPTTGSQRSAGTSAFEIENTEHVSSADSSFARALVEHKKTIPPPNAPHSTAQKYEQLDPLGSFQSLAISDFVDRGTTPGGVMLPRGPVNTLQGVGMNSHAAAKEMQDPAKGRQSGNIQSGTTNLPYRTPHLAQAASIGMNTGGVTYSSNLPYIGAGISARSSTAGSSDQFASTPAVSPLQSNVPPAIPSTRDAKALAKFIMDGGLAEDDSNSKVGKSQVAAPSSTPRMGNSAQLYPTLPAVIVQQSPQHLDVATQDFLAKANPSLEEICRFMPFVELCKETGPTNLGVIQISDIPYNTRKNEIVAFVGRNAKLANQPTGSAYFAIHIIMERQTAKSMDCFVEYETQSDAEFASTRYNPGGRRPRIGDRCVRVELSSQEALMTELFPRAKCVQWQGQDPIILPPNGPYSTGFQGFTAGEELVMTAKYAENPNRSRFAVKHPQRAYESMISLLAKYPWWATDKITLSERDNIFRATRDCVKAFVECLNRGTSPEVLTPYLFQELLTVALKAPGFSERQRAEIMVVASPIVQVPPIFISSIAGSWPFDVLRRKPDVAEPLVQYYARLLEAAHRQTNMNQYLPPSAFGNFRVNYPEDKVKATMTLDQAAALEWQAIQAVIGYFYGAPVHS